jgi:hypothetical protein
MRFNRGHFPKHVSDHTFLPSSILDPSTGDTRMNVRRVESFLLRVVVQEEGPGTHALAWRGRIQHVTTGNERQFEQLQDLLAFIATHVGQDDGVAEQDPAVASD